MTKQNNKGFTIIEVVLVLAIAGLIFLIVFLALPALQRSRRDTQRKNDVGRFVAALESYAGNNNGGYPLNQADTNTMVGGYLTNAGSVFKDPSTGADYTVNYGSGTSIPAATSLVQGTIYYRTGAICGTAEGTLAAGSARNAAAITDLESGLASCQDNQ